MKRKKALLNLSKANANQVRDKSSTIISKMTGNLTYATPNPTLASIATQSDVVKTKQAEQAAAFQTYQQKTVELETEKDNLLNLLVLEGYYVDGIANGDEARILGAGFDVKKDPTPVGELDAPTNMLAVEGNGPGKIDCTWKVVKGAKSYNVEKSVDITDDSKWEHSLTVTKAKCTLDGVPSGSRIWVRVSAIGAAGEGAFSDVTTRIAP